MFSRITSYFGNSFLGMKSGTPAEGKVKALLDPHAAELLPGAIDGYALPVSGRIRGQSQEHACGREAAGGRGLDRA